MWTQDYWQLERRYTYVLITGIPVWNRGDAFLTDDRWARDIGAQVPLWDAVVVACPLRKASGTQANLVRVPEGIQWRTWRGWAGMLLTLASLVREGKNGKYVFEFAGTSNAGIIGFVIAWVLVRGRLPLFITFDAPLDLVVSRVLSERCTLKKWLRAAWLAGLRCFRKFAAKRAVGVMVVGEAIAREFDPDGQYLSKCLTIPLTLFEEQDLYKRDHITMSDEGRPIVVGCADRMAPEKGVRELVLAFEEVARAMPRVELHLWGDGPERHLLEQLCKERSLDNKVMFHGHVAHDELLEALRAVDILVNLTKASDINRTLWEGAARSCALIASNNLAVRSFFTHGKDAFLVDPRDQQALARALETLCTDSALRSKLSDGAYELARRNTNRAVKERRREWIHSRLASR